MAKHSREIGGKEHFFFQGHTDAVLCCALDNNLKLAATGGVDDIAIVWDLCRNQARFRMKNHLDSVIAVDFSLNSTLCLSADMQGHLQVCHTNTGMKVFEFDTDEIRWAMFHNISENVLFAGTVSGVVWMWHVLSEQGVKPFPSYGHATTTAKLFPDGGRIIIAYADCSIRIFDLKSGNLVNQFHHPSKSEITTIALENTKELIAIGCVDASVRLVHAKKLKLCREFHCPTSDEAKTKIIEGYRESDEKGEADSPIGEITFDQTVKREKVDQEDVAMQEDQIVEDTKQDIKPKNEPCCDNEAEEQVPNDPIEVEELNDEPDSDSDHGGDTDKESNYDPKDLSEAIEVVSFSENGEFLLACNNLGSIYIFDTERQKERCCRHLAIGITCGIWNNNNMFILGCSDGTVRIFDPNIDLIQAIETHQDQILDLVYKKGSLATVSDDRSLAVVHKI